MPFDILLFAGGAAFLWLAYLSFFNRDRLWKLYSMEKGWRKRNPERTPEWDEKAKRQGRAFVVIGIITIIASVLLVGGA